MHRLAALLPIVAFSCARADPALPDAGEPEDGASLDAAPLDAAPLDAAPEDAGFEPITFGACDPTEVPPGYVIPAGLECALVEVAIDRSAPEGDTILLRVAVDRALGSPKGAIFQLAGGPGGSAVAQASIIRQVLPRLRNDFDLVYVDQRGTGASGYLDCPDSTPAGLRGCAAALAPLDLDHYLSADAADDVDEVSRRMGYQQIMLRGGSYGTRVGLEFARRHPERARAIVLDGVVRPEDDFFTSVIVKADRGVEALIADCAADVRCTSIAPDLETDLQALLQQAETAPRRIFVDGTPSVEDQETFRTALTYTVEDWYFRFRMPRALHEAAGGDYRAWDAILSELFGVTITSDQNGMQTSYVALGVYLTVVCAEFWPNVASLSELEALQGMQTWGSTDILELARLCPEWPVSPIPPEQRLPVVSDVPTLLMSGAIDFVTPAEGGDIAARTLSHSLHVVVPDATHATMITPCGSDIITQFFEADGDFSALDLSCVDTYEVAFE